MLANKMRKKLSMNEWKVTIVDRHRNHYYQPGFLFVPFGINTPKQLAKPQRVFFRKGIDRIQAKVERVDPGSNRVELDNGEVLDYDLLVIATGTRIVPEETEGLKGDGWHRDIFDFYTYEGSVALAEKLRSWKGGKLVVSITEMPIKCPVAPLEFVFLADWWFTKQGLRDKVELTYVTPLPSAFTKPKAAKVLGNMLSERNIKLEAEFSTGSVDSARRKLISWDEREVDYDLLVITPVNMGAEYIETSGLGDDLNFVPTDPNTLQTLAHENIFALGDATNLPTSKAGSVAHFQAEILEENILRAIAGEPLKKDFDGHANCFVESGYGKAICIDFNYDTEPLPGKFPYGIIGPLSLLKETRINHWAKLSFRLLYWRLLKGLKVPMKPQMSMRGKVVQ